MTREELYQAEQDEIQNAPVTVKLTQEQIAHILRKLKVEPGHCQGNLEEVIRNTEILGILRSVYRPRTVSDYTTETMI